MNCYYFMYFIVRHIYLFVRINVELLWCKRWTQMKTEVFFMRLLCFCVILNVSCNLSWISWTFSACILIEVNVYGNYEIHFSLFVYMEGELLLYITNVHLNHNKITYSQYTNLQKTYFLFKTSSTSWSCNLKKVIQ